MTSSDPLYDASTLSAFAEPPWVTGAPSPYYDESHHALRKYLLKWLKEHLPDSRVSKWDTTGYREESVFEQAGRDGILLGFAFGTRMNSELVSLSGVRPPCGIKPEDWNPFHDFVMVDTLASVGSGSAFMGLHSGIAYGSGPIIHFASDAMKKRIMPDVLNGKKKICLALTENNAGSDVANIGGTTAEKTSDGKFYIVNGLKKWITNGIYSDYFTTLVRTSGKPGDPKGLSFLLIPKTEGVTLTKMKMIGAHASGTTLVEFDDVKVPVENLIGQEGAGLKYCFYNFNHERATIAWICLRQARVCLQDAINHASTRIVFKQPLLSQPVVRHKIAQCARQVESLQTWSESLVYETCKLTTEQSNKQLGGRTALLKAHAGLVFENVARESLHILGGLGITQGAGSRGERIERLYREVQMSTIPGGAEAVLLDLGVREEVKIIDAKKKSGAPSNAKGRL
ncbi:unnamed protein product [Sympodiomycopsis kandeliae]